MALFPSFPEDVKALSDEDLASLLADHVSAAQLIDASDEEFLKDLSADEIIAEYRTGVEQIKTLRAETDERVTAFEAFEAERAKLSAEVTPTADATKDDEDSDEPDSDKETEEAPVEVVTEVLTEVVTEVKPEEVQDEVVEEKVLVTASSEPRFSRRPPTPSQERMPVTEEKQPGTSLVASASFKADNPGPLDQDSLAHLMRDVAMDLGTVAHDGKLVQRMKVDPWQVDTYADGRRVEIGGGVMQWDGPKTKVARADFEFSQERTLDGSDDYEKIRAVLPETVQFLGKPGGLAGEALVASGGLCAPLTPIYSMPNFGTEAEPVWDSLPVFRAARGGVNVPAATYIADIDTALSSISEANDALGGTFATKSCQDLDCPAYTETAVNIFAHCREYGNLNARAWPEKIAHENALTMQALSRTSETFMLNRIKALSINVTQAAVGAQYGSFASLVHAVVKASAGIKYRLRMPRTSNFRVLLPSWIPDHLAADNAAEAFDRYLAQDELERRLSNYRITVGYYLDDVTGGTSQGFAAETAGALDEFPDDVQYAIFPEGQFLGIDSGVLELGIVRDSTLNSTNDFQVFGERFRNLAMLGPAQGALWVTQDICPTGSAAAAATALSC